MERYTESKQIYRAVKLSKIHGLIIIACIAAIFIDGERNILKVRQTTSAH